ncbi:autotransporter domain-containing protein [Parendozoicomonas haliclonae]|uniref:Autotransporter beta-domain protein n=1 Tax=Parendozoicomonas haliclonae TaxID=1960125 RepID=A0A1X7AMX6_9GAMM|nr:autotransporter domain-containing protein [Parendozoicomonas haliclonae]SMA49400.1 Autotransporter beta-domain protein [Parendozoicomonas haliclonae]
MGLVTVTTATADEQYIGSGHYTTPIKASQGSPVFLSGDVSFTGSDQDPSTIITVDNSSLSGNVERLNILLQANYQTAIESLNTSTTQLVGPITITAAEGLSDNYGLRLSGGNSTLNFQDPVTITMHGDFDNPVEHRSGNTTFRGGLFISTGGQYAIGLFTLPLGDSNIYLDGSTTINISGGGEAIYNAGGTVHINAPLTVNAKADMAIVINAQPSVTISQIGTRTSESQPVNPQTIQLNGPIQLQKPAALLFLDLDAGSQINSKLALTAGHMKLFFQNADTRFSPQAGSTIGSGATLSLSFTEQGVWQIPLIAEYQNSGTASVIPLTVEEGGQLLLSGQGTLQGLINDPLMPGESKTYVLLKTEGSNTDILHYALNNLTPVTDSEGYLLTFDQSESENHDNYLLGTVARTIPELVDPPEPPEPPQPSEPSPPPQPSQPVPTPPMTSIPAPLNYLPHQALPITMMDQQFAGQLLQSFQPKNTDTTIHQQPWMGINSGDDMPPPALQFQMLPFISSQKGHGYRLYGFHQQWLADFKGLGFRLQRQLTDGQLSAGYAAGESNSQTHKLPEQVKGHADYRSYFISGETGIHRFRISSQILYQQGKHHQKQQLPSERMFTHSNSHLTVAQTGISAPMMLGEWGIQPQLQLAWWGIHQGSYLAQAQGLQLHISGNSQRYWQATPAVSLTGPQWRVGTTSCTWQTDISLGYSTVWGSRAMKNTLLAYSGSQQPVRLTSPALDKHTWQYHLGLTLNGTTRSYLPTSGTVGYTLNSSSHSRAQEITTTATWVF